MPVKYAKAKLEDVREKPSGIRKQNLAFSLINRAFNPCGQNLSYGNPHLQTVS